MYVVIAVNKSVRICKPFMSFVVNKEIVNGSGGKLTGFYQFPFFLIPAIQCIGSDNPNSILVTVNNKDTFIQDCLKCFFTDIIFHKSIIYLEEYISFVKNYRYDCKLTFMQENGKVIEIFRYIWIGSMGYNPFTVIYTDTLCCTEPNSADRIL